MAIMRTNSSGSTGLRSASGVPAVATSALMGTLSGCGIQIRQRHQHGAAIVDRFAHADDAARADGDSRLADVGQRLQAVLVGTRADDAAVERLRGVEVVVVGGQACLGQPVGLSLPSACPGCNTPPAPCRCTPRTMARTSSNAGPSLTSRQAAPMQNRVAPAAFARVARHPAPRRTSSCAQDRRRCRISTTAGNRRNLRGNRRSSPTARCTAAPRPGRGAGGEPTAPETSVRARADRGSRGLASGCIRSSPRRTVFITAAPA